MSDKGEKRVLLYDRLPDIYKIKDEEQSPPGQLKSYLALVEKIFGSIHENIENLYDNLFIETCDDWAIPYIGDLLGTSHLKGDPWTLRADVADTIALRRRKGTIASLDQLTYDLTKWGVHCTELRENLVWNQHLNHQRPDAGGDPPYSLPNFSRFTPIRGGTITVRDPAMLSLLDSPFDPFAHVADIKPPAYGNIRYNLPNLAIFLWRLKDYRVQTTKPLFRGRNQVDGTFVLRFDVHPLGARTTLFNTYQFDPDKDPPVVTEVDGTPGPIMKARLTSGSEAGVPENYFAIDTYYPGHTDVSALDISDVGLQLHLPEPDFAGQEWPKKGIKSWTIRGANLCAWEEGIQPRVGVKEVVIDPVIGRILIGVGSKQEAIALENQLLITYTYGAVGEVGAHPITRSPVPSTWHGSSVEYRKINYNDDPDALAKSLADLDSATSPIVVEITDSMVHSLDLADAALTGTILEDGGKNLNLNRSLIIRAADGQRPIIMLKNPLRFRPVEPENGSHIDVRLEGLYLTKDKSFPQNEALIARAAVNSLELLDCTLDPGGALKLDDSRTHINTCITLQDHYGFGTDDEKEFDQTPDILLKRTICGPIHIDTDYTLYISDCVIDAGKGVDEDPGDEVDYGHGKGFAVTGATNPKKGWGPPTQIQGATFLGRMRVESIHGSGGIWARTLEVLNNQKGCIRYSYFSGKMDRLPQNLGCVRGSEVDLHFVSEIFGESAYGQLAHTSDRKIRGQGPDNDAMGAFGFLLEAHKWRNLKIRFREFMPVGIRPLFIPIT